MQFSSRMKKVYPVIFLIFLLSGCDKSNSELLVYNLDSSCLQKNNNPSCEKLRIYYSANINAITERQEISYAMHPKFGNNKKTIFGKLVNCDIIDQENFSCAGLTMSQGDPSYSSALGGQFISRSAVLYFWAIFSDTVSLDAFHFWNSINLMPDWITWAPILYIFIALFTQIIVNHLNKLKSISKSLSDILLVLEGIHFHQVESAKPRIELPPGFNSKR